MFGSLGQCSQGAEHRLQTRSDLSSQNPGGQMFVHVFKCKKLESSQLVHSKAETEQLLQGEEQALHLIS